MIKKLIFISGTMGVGKTTVSKLLLDELPNSAFLDGDWCWNINPFIVNDENKKMVIDNICFLLNSFIRNTSILNIIFCWVMNKQEIVEEIKNKIIGEFDFYNFTLLTDPELLRIHFESDINKGIRENYDIKKATDYMDDYKMINSIKIYNFENNLSKTIDKIKEYLK